MAPLSPPPVLPRLLVPLTGQPAPPPQSPHSSRPSSHPTPLTCFQSPSGAVPFPSYTSSETLSHFVSSSQPASPETPPVPRSATHTPSPMPSLQAGSPSSSSTTPLQPLSSGEADVRGSGVSPDAARQEKGLGHPQVTYRSLLERSAAEVEHGWLPGRRRRADWLQGCLWLPGHRRAPGDTRRRSRRRCAPRRLPPSPFR